MLACQVFQCAVCVGLIFPLFTFDSATTDWHGFKDLDPHLSNACSPLVRQNTTSTQESDRFGPIFSKSLWYLTNSCGLHHLVIPPQWASFGFGPLVDPFGHMHTCKQPQLFSGHVDISDSLSSLALICSILRGCVWILKVIVTKMFCKIKLL